jgi:hypothetical protein
LTLIVLRGTGNEPKTLILELPVHPVKNGRELIQTSFPKQIRWIKPRLRQLDKPAVLLLGHTWQKTELRTDRLGQRMKQILLSVCKEIDECAWKGFERSIVINSRVPLPWNWSNVTSFNSCISKVSNLTKSLQNFPICTARMRPPRRA